MTSCTVLERPGRWRGVAVAALLVLPLLPAVPLLASALGSGETAVVGRTFGRALTNSAVVAVLVAVISFGVGLPAGVLNALYDYRGRRVLLALAALPLLAPSFLWALSWSSLAARLHPAASGLLAGHGGCTLVFLSGAFALVLFTSSAAAAALSASQVEAARLAGGESAVFRYAWRHAAVPAALAAVLAGVLTLSDPGPGQILGLRTAASEVLTSFAAQYDFDLAARQCAALALVVLVVALPLAWLASPRLAAQMLARQVRGARRSDHGGMSVAVACGMFAVVLVFTLAPVVGLVLPLRRGADLVRAWGEVGRTWYSTLLYAVGAGTVAAALGLTLAFCAGREERLRRLCLGACLALFALPPTLSALGLVRVAAEAPAWTDPFLRSQLTVCLALGLRFFPVAAVLGLRSWGAMPASLAWAGGVHGVPLWTYLRRVVAPLQRPAVVTALLLVGLLATAEVGTVLLLHPPGRASLPLALFTVMANAPESLVASLCAVYLATATALLAATWALAGGGRT
jgi:iron(III) transport system permease protein